VTPNKKGAVALFAKKIIKNKQKREAFADATDPDKDVMIDAALGPEAGDLPDPVRDMFKGLSKDELSGLAKMQAAMTGELVESANTHEGPATLAKL
jgi:hypothetical protein